MDLGIIQKLAKCIVRPPKSNYKSTDLVPQCFELKHRIYEHHQFYVINNRGLKLQGSYLKDRYSPKPRDTIFFLHANGSCRLVIKNYLETFLPFYDLIAFDFAGCGLSEGEYITLGYNEREDVYAIMNYARKEFGITNVILWGRSMGAATALLYTAKYGEVKAIISDNSYADLEVLITELSDDYLPFLPSFLVDGIINSIQQYIEQILWKKEMTDFNIRKLKPVKLVDKISCPIIFIGSTQDTFVNVKHTKELYARTRAPKWLQLVHGNHNDPRSAEIKEKILKYLQEIMENHIISAKIPHNKERVGMFQELSSPTVTKTSSPKVLNSPMDVKLVNCAQLEFQPTNATTNKIQEKVSKDLSSMDSSNSEKKSRESYLQRKMKQGEKYKRNRSRSGIKRKKIFQGIDLISEHLNGQQN